MCLRCRVKSEVKKKAMAVLTPAGSGPAEELVRLGVPEEDAEAFPLAQLGRRCVVLLGFFLRHGS